MKIRNIAIISLLLLILFIPVSFAGDIDLTDNSTNYSNSIDDSENLNSVSTNLKDNLLNDDSISNESINSEEKESLNSNKLSENSYSSSSLDSNEVSDSISLSSDGIRLPDLNNDFAKFNITLSDSNTIYVNSSYNGSEELGTKLNPFKTLYDGINAVDSILNNVFIADGVYEIDNTIYIGKSMSIIGESLSVILDGLNNKTLFSVYSASTELSIFNVTFRNGYSDRGGAIYNDQSTLNLIGDVFENNTAYVNLDKVGYAGAIYNNAGFLKLYNTSFINNKLITSSNLQSEGYGGAIYNKYGEMAIFNSRFYNNSIDLRNITNTTYAAGGAIFTQAGFVTIFNSTLNSNSIYANYSLGGVISIWSSRNVYILNSTLNDNIISGKYGFASAISNKGTLLHIENSTISNNNINASSTANSTVYNLNGNLKIINSEMENNRIKATLSNQLLCLEDQLILDDVFDDNDYSNILNELNLTVLPSYYDLRDEGLVTSVKNQGSSGACWTFAFLAAMESYLLKYENISYDFSENNMKNIMGDGGENSTDWDDGGNYVVALAYLLRWSGPVNESDDPFNAHSMDSPHNLTPVKILSDVAYIPLRLGYLDNDQIKLAILKYGALFAPIYSGILRSGSSGYSNIQTLDNHAIAIVGWDDNYSASNFRQAPPGDGAFIIKNSWGPYSGDSGYYYVSYYDASFMASIETCSAVAIVNITNITEYKNNYQHDIFGNTFESVGYNSDTIWFANQFTAENNNPLSAFGFYTYGASTYAVNITVNNRTVYTSSGSISSAGYHTIKLSNYIPLKTGDSFKITVKLTTPSSLFPLAIESLYSGYTSRAKSALNQSFISPDGNNWYDMANANTRSLKFYEDMYFHIIKNASVCLKAYTAFADELALNLSSNSSIYYTGDSIRINITLSNKGDYASNISVPVSLDKGINVSSYNIVLNSRNSSVYPHYNSSSFDRTSNVWSIDNLNNRESISLILIAKLQSNKNLIINASASSSTYSIYDVVNGNMSLIYRIPTKFDSVTDIDTCARSYDVLNFTLKDINNNTLANKNVYLEIISSDSNSSISNVTLKTNDNGLAKFTLNLTLGNYKFRLRFNGDSTYQSSEMEFAVNVSKRKATQIIYKNMTTYSVIEAIDGRIGEYFNVTLKDCDGHVIANKPIKIGFNGKIYNKTTDSNGVARLQINLKVPNTYTFAICFLSDDDYYASFEVSKITVIKKKMALTVPNVSYKSTAKTKTLTATLKDNNNKLTSGKTLTFTVNGKSYTAKTNSKGVASVKVSLSTKKTYSFTVKFAGDDYYGAVTKSGKVTIK